MRNRLGLFWVGLRGCIVAIWPAYLIATSLIFWGFAWSIPNNPHIDKSFHADENAAVWGVNQIHFPGFNPHVFNWGTALIYQVYVLKLVFSLGGFVHVGNAGLILLGRLAVWLSAIGALTCLYLLCRDLYDRWTAQLAVLILAVLPGFVINCHYFKTDIAMVFWLLSAFLIGYRLIATGKTGYVYALGLLVGYSISTKYSAMAAVPVGLVFILMAKGETRTFRSIGIYGACMGAGFLIGTPRVLPNPHEFLQALRLGSKIGRAASPWAVARGPGWSDYLTRIARLAMTVPIWISAVIGMVWLTIRRGRTMLPVLVFVATYTFLLNADNNRLMRYEVPLLPIAALAVAGLLGDLRQTGIAGRYVALSIATLLIGYALLFTMSYVHVMTEEDPRIQASEWIAAHAPRNAPFPVSTTHYLGAPQVQLWGYEKLDVGSDLAALRAAASPYVAVSEYLTEKYYGALDHYPAVKDYFEYIDTNYSEVAHFENSQRLLWIDSKESSTATHDWLYPNPRVTIFRRRDFP